MITYYLNIKYVSITDNSTITFGWNNVQNFGLQCFLHLFLTLSSQLSLRSGIVSLSLLAKLNFPTLSIFDAEGGIFFVDCCGIPEEAGPFSQDSLNFYSAGTTVTPSRRRRTNSTAATALLSGTNVIKHLRS